MSQKKIHPTLHFLALLYMNKNIKKTQILKVYDIDMTLTLFRKSIGEFNVANHCNKSLQIDWNYFNWNFKSC